MNQTDKCDASVDGKLEESEMGRDMLQRTVMRSQAHTEDKGTPPANVLVEAPRLTARTTEGEGKMRAV